MRIRLSGAILLCAYLVSNGIASAAADRVVERNEAMAHMDEIVLRSGKKLPYYHTHSILKKDQSINTVLIIIPGGESNGPGYFAAGVDAARNAGRLGTTAVITPQFQRPKQNPRSGELYWTARWQQGANSLDGSLTSSFTVLDEILELAVGNFPNAGRIILAGHSSGGQIINRYIGVGGAIADHETVRFIVMNPSSYLYVDDRRVQKDGSYAPPSNAAKKCPKYNHWKYGLVGLPPYAAKLTDDDIRNRMFRRKVVLLAGGADTKTGKSVDDRCPALYQGRNRLQRTKNYWGYVQTFSEWKSNASLEIIPGVGHAGAEMIRSSEFQDVVFKN